MAKGRGRGAYQFTSRRRVALKKAQRISARKRKGRGNSKAAVAGFAGGVGVMALAGTAYYLGSRTTSHKNTPGGSNNSHPMGTDPSKDAGDIVAPTFKERKNRIDPQAPTTRLRNSANTKTPAQRKGSVQAPKRKGSTASAPAHIVQAAQQAQGVAVPVRKGATPITSTPSTVNTTTAASNATTSGYKTRALGDIIKNPQEHDQIAGWKVYSREMQDYVKANLEDHGFKVSESNTSGLGGVLYYPRTRGRKAAATRRRNAAKK